MKFDTPATTNPIDQLKVVGKPTDRIDGPLKTTGTAPYAYERHDVAPERGLRLHRRRRHRQGPHHVHRPRRRAKAAPGVLAIVTAENAGKLGKGKLQHRQAAGRPERRALPPGHRAGGGRDLRAGARRRAAAQRRLRRAPTAPSTWRSGEGVDRAARPTRPRQHGRRLRRRLRQRRGASSTRPTPRPTSRTR